MLYASTRLALTRTLGSQHFTDSLFATSKSDLTPSAYRTHLAHLNAPKPLSAREREMADVLAAERVAGRGSGPAVDHVGAASTGSGVGLGWGEGVREALLELPTREENKGWLVLLVSKTGTRPSRDRG
jgi:twinfilin